MIRIRNLIPPCSGDARVATEQVEAERNNLVVTLREPVQPVTEVLVVFSCTTTKIDSGIFEALATQAGLHSLGEAFNEAANAFSRFNVVALFQIQAHICRQEPANAQEEPVDRREVVHREFMEDQSMVHQQRSEKSLAFGRELKTHRAVFQPSEMHKRFGR
ncbi:hypothetical protein EAH83_18490 [Variovorax ginsengisoli]|uniref:Uncharacterized protein n=1 Tax=Variovorax guangxiensis TaxID=1775474 RepID=A0A502DJP1_9BURK|nr:hypothetical protein EAH83_18490 [Variovorax ginsengisoli]TPG25675.1 hypothetical protein EAH82_14645 [Variovorax guangxiensis]